MNNWTDRRYLRDINRKLKDDFCSLYANDSQKLIIAINWIEENYNKALLSRLEFYHEEWNVWSVRRNYWQVKFK